MNLRVNPNEAVVKEEEMKVELVSDWASKNLFFFFWLSDR